MIKLNKTIAGTTIFIALTGSAIAGECDDDPKYNYKNGHRAVYPSSYLSSSVASNVKICIDSDVPYIWRQATKNGISRLNSSLNGSDSLLRFSYQTGGNCTFSVSMDYNMEDKYYAEVKNPIKPGVTTVFINANRETISSAIKAEHVMMHELLHTVGLFHTGRSLYAEVPDTDDYWDAKYAGRSLMCAQADAEPYPQRHLNFLDIRTLETIYPK